MVINLMRIITLDVSKRRIGVAVSDRDFSFIVESFLILTNRRSLLTKILEKYPADLILIGLPIDFGHIKSNNFNFVKHFAHSFRDIITPYMFIDERFSSNLAERIKEMNQSIKSIDELSACVLMERAFANKLRITELYQQKIWDKII